MSNIKLNRLQSISVIRWYISLLALSRGILYTPVIVSVALFIVYIPRLLVAAGNIHGFQLFQPPYSALNILNGKSNWMSVIGIIISYLEYTLREYIKLSLKAKSLIVIGLVTLGYSILTLLLITKTDVAYSVIALFILPLYGLSLVSLLLSTGWWYLLNWCNELLKKASSNTNNKSL